MLEIRLLGQLNLRQDGVDVEVSSRPARVLLAYLVLTRGTHHPRERLAGLLWPDSSESNARKNLRQALWQLRKAVGEAHLVVDADSIAFNSASDHWLDVGVLENTADQVLEKAASVYEGELLPGYYEDWVLLERDRLAAAFDRKMDRLLMQLIQEQRWPDVIDWAERWIAQGNVPEAAFRVLMMAYAATGELAKVDAVYQRCFDALQQHVGVDPSKETIELYESLLAGGTAALSPVSDVPTPQQVNLPAQPTPFIGRKEEIEEIERLLSNTRLLTLVGPGGMGKTRLALKVAQNSRGLFSNGVCFVSLASIRTPNDMVQIIADALEFPLSTAEDPEDQLLGYLRNRQLLLVMDNFETVMDGAVLASKILQASPKVKILATSREKLGLQGEVPVTVAGMDFPASGFDGDYRAHDSIELLEQSAQRARPGFALAGEDLGRAARICQMVEGMPLAIELAAAWLDTLSLEEIENELEQGLSILSTEMRDVPDRHRNIRAVFGHSWSLIGRDEREAFMRLSVFREGFSREAAQQVAGASLELLAALVRKSFVRHDAGAGRFDIHELMRQYAQERLEEVPESRDATHEAHARYYAKFMDERWGPLRDRRQVEALNEIEADIENIRAAWRYSVGRRNAGQIRMFIKSMRRVYYWRGWNYAARELFASAAEALQAVANDEEAMVVSAEAQGHQALFSALLGFAEEAYELAKPSVDTLKVLERPAELALALDGLHLSSLYLGRFLEEEEAAAQMLDLAANLEDAWFRAHALYLNSMEVFRKDEFAEARHMAESSLAISERAGDLLGTVWPLSVLGHISSAQGKYEEAERYYQRSLAVAKEIEFRWGTENSIKYLGQLALARGEVSEAKAYFLQSIQLAEEIGLGRDLVNLMYEYARALAAEGASENAVKLLSLVIEHPAGNLARIDEVRIRDSAQRLLSDLEEELPKEAYAEAVERGKRLELEEVVADLLAGRLRPRSSNTRRETDDGH